MNIKKTLFVMAVVPALFLSASLAEAKKGGNGHENKSKHSEKHDHGPDHNSRIIIDDSDRVTIRDYIADDYRQNCPPGLAKKNNGCLPPGQAKKLYVIGEPLPGHVDYRPISRHLRARLQPAPSGHQYVQVDQDVLLMNEASKKIIDAVTLMSAAR